ncbi:MAG TPA: EAL domain-containing protein, partial [Steroidobacteraceae bacterium]|nr:EAL domain-containing protein [Steroidobacteraceae bacterium]
MSISYTPWLVVLSVAVAILVCYAALGLAARVAEARGAAGRAWLALGACSLGIGAWSMHFIGMLALSMPIRLMYSVGVIVASLGVAVVTSGFAIHIAGSQRLDTARHLVCSVVMGLGIAAMHYIGMSAILMVPAIRYALPPVVASLLIAIAASWVALWLIFVLRASAGRFAWLARAGAAVLMGGAISGMHYTAMSAVIIAPNAYCRGGVALGNGWFAIALAVGVLGMLAITILSTLFDAHLSARNRLYVASMESADRALLHQAAHDTLTGLPNRSSFLDCLRQAVERVRRGEQSTLAVLFLDLDRFKFVNDTQGHEAGDALLRQIAARLSEEMRRERAERADAVPDVVSRFGGDEFLVLLNGLRQAKDAQAVAARLQAVLSPSYFIQGRDVHCSASIGIVTYPQGAASADEIVRNADVAMYEAKRAGRACTVQFNQNMHVRISRHVEIESGLRRAIGSNEMQVLYQPIVNLDTGRMTSVEALVRWRHPTLGDIPPGEFIPIAEESGLIVALDGWVREQACRAMREWYLTDPGLAPDTVSVNVSRVELARSQEFRWQIAELLRAARLPAHRLQLEVTERNVMRDAAAILQLMRDLKALGVRLAMDDFGTGTSSLSILRTYPFDVIKIDRSFVQGLVS